MRHDIPIRGNNTNNYCEAAMRILKDQIFERDRAFSPVQLLDFILTRLTNYYERCMTDLANGRIDVHLSRKYFQGQGKITRDMVTVVAQESDHYDVVSETKENQSYQVDMVLGMCTCADGLNSAPCKHQYAVMQYFGIQSRNVFPIQDEKMRKHLFYLATGSQCVPSDWYHPLSDGISSVDQPAAGASNDKYADINHDEVQDSSVVIQDDPSDLEGTGADSALRSLHTQRNMHTVCYVC